MERGKATGQGRAVFNRTGDALVFKYFSASGLFERGQLQGGRLVVGRCSRITYFHAPILLLTYATCKALFLFRLLDVAKLTICATGAKK